MTSQVEDKHKYTVDTLPGRSITLGFWYWLVGFCLMVFNASSNNFSFISWRSVLLMEEIGVPRENHRPAASHWQTLSHNVVWLEGAWARLELTTLVVIDTDCTGSCKSNHYTITTTTTPLISWCLTQLQQCFNYIVPRIYNI